MKTPSVAIDGFNLAMLHGTGVATYGIGVAEAARSLGMSVEALFGIPLGADPRLREILFFEAFGRGAIPRKGPAWYRAVVDRWAVLRGLRVQEMDNAHHVEQRGFADRLPAFDRIRSAPWLFERADRHFQRTRRFLNLRMPDPPTIMHWTYPVPIKLIGARNVYTLHDLVPLKLPYATLDRKRSYFRLIERCVAEADHIVTVSDSSRNDVIDLFGIPPERITNTYQHAPMPATASGHDDDVADLKGIFDVEPDKYFLYFGAIEPKKNIGRLIEAYLSISTDTPLVIVGARAWQSENELRLIGGGAGGGGMRPKGIGGSRIIQLDYLPRRLLMKLASGARAVLFPSLYEGFGLPVLEAMSLGTPVVTSSQGSLPEVAGDAAILVDPYNVSELAAAIRRVDSDSGLRDLMRARGMVQANRFSLDQHRRQLHAVYESILSCRPEK